MIVFIFIAYLVEGNVDYPCGGEGSPANTNHGLHGCWQQVLGISVVINNLHVVMNLVDSKNGEPVNQIQFTSTDWYELVNKIINRILQKVQYQHQYEVDRLLEKA